MRGPFHGALTIPIGFGLNPRKYAYGLLSSAVKNGGKVIASSPVIDLKKNKRDISIDYTARL